jgi:hypothetical protein
MDDRNVADMSSIIEGAIRRYMDVNDLMVITREEYDDLTARVARAEAE